MPLLNKAEIAWAAGLFDGEGSAGRYKQAGARTTFRSRASMFNTEMELLTRFQSVVCVGKIGGPVQRKNPSPKHAPCFYWQTDKADDVASVLALLRPYLGSYKITCLETACSK